MYIRNRHIYEKSQKRFVLFGYTRMVDQRRLKSSLIVSAVAASRLLEYGSKED